MPKRFGVGDDEGLKELMRRLEKAEEEAKDYKDMLQRTQADFLNYKRRVEEERSEQVRRASAGIIDKLLPVVDDFGRAIEAVPPDQSGAEWLKGIKNEGIEKHQFNAEVVSNLRMSEYLTGPDELQNAGLQDILVFAIKREQDAIDYYSRMTGILKEKKAKELCKNLVNEELSHKLKLETLYDDLIYRED